MNGYHDHLDRCAQCRNNPFGLCADGARALEAEALRVTSGPTPFHAAPVSHDDGMGAEAIRFGVPNERAIAYGNALVERLNAAEAKRARKRAARLARGGR